ncbi:MAG: hypothetical protein EBU08_16770, partial [Micrococcales bacterium]|nr:hypothetical protein [Micrococcales bacterium]
MAQVTLTDFLKNLYAADDKTRLTIANDLKKAGFLEGAVSGKKEDFLKLQSAIIAAEKEIAQLKTVVGEIDRVTYYKTRKPEPASGTGAGGGSSFSTQKTTRITNPTDATALINSFSTQKTTRITNPTDATALINSVFESVLGRPATAAEMKEIKPQLEKAEKAAPVTTKYRTVNGVTTADTTGGIDSQQFIVNLINKTPKFKAETEKIKKTAPEILKRTEEKKIYDEAVIGMTPEQLAAFNKTSTYGLGLDSTKATIAEYATRVGAELDDVALTQLAKDVYDSALENDTVKIREFVRAKLNIKPGTEAKGEAGNVLADLRKTATANGLDLDKVFGSSLGSWIQNIDKGESVDTYKRLIRNTAKIGMPQNIASLLDNGVDLEAVYSPYKNVMASVLEINPESITLNDPTLRSAIAGDKELPIYEFQRQLRKDNRWQYTNQAREEVSDV